MRSTRVPLGSVKVCSDFEVVWPLMVVLDEDVLKDWNVELDIVAVVGGLGVLFRLYSLMS